MKVEKAAKVTGTKTSARVGHYNNFKGHAMVRIEGNFMGGGFSLSKGKLIAVLENLKELRPFVEGKLDEAILKLKDDEILRP